MSKDVFWILSLSVWSMVGFLALLGGTLLMGIANGLISCRNLFNGVTPNGNVYFSPERVQLFVATIAMSIQYLFSAVTATDGKMPDLPPAMLGIFAASSSVYVGSKGLSAIIRTFKSQEAN